MKGSSAMRALEAAGRPGRAPIAITPSHKGLLHKNLGVPAGSPIPAKKLAAAKKSPGPAVRKRATFAENAKSWRHGVS